MEFYRDDQKKMIQIWLTKAESQDEALRERLAPLYTEWKEKKYIVAVYHSGKRICLNVLWRCWYTTRNAVPN